MRRKIAPTLGTLIATTTLFIGVDSHRAIAAPPAPAAALESAVMAALDDATIVAIFDEANTADIETSALAAKKGSSKEVRDFGAMLAHDHTAVRQQGRDLATKLGVTPTPPSPDQSMADHKAAMATLRAKSGKEFDKAYAAHEVAYHQAVIDAINKTLLPAIQNAELKALVEKVAPAFNAHLVAAQQLQSKLGA